MTANGWLQIGVFLLAIFAVTPLLGGFMARVFSRQKTWLDPVARPLERLIYKLTGVDETREMRWTEYAVAVLMFSVVSMLVLYVMQRLQHVLPLNPQGFGPVAPDLAFNTAVSFTTNTNWQAYGGETTMSYFTQMAGLAYHNFVSAAVGISVAIAFIRGIAQREKDTLGNFWVDMVRATLWVLLPIAIVGALFLVSQGVVQNLKPYDKVAVDRSADRQLDRRRRQATDDRRQRTDTSPRDRWRRRRSSSSSAPMAAASSTPTVRIRSRIPRRCRTSSRCSGSSRSRPVSPTRSGR